MEVSHVSYFPPDVARFIRYTLRSFQMYTSATVHLNHTLQSIMYEYMTDYLNHTLHYGMYASATVHLNHTL